MGYTEGRGEEKCPILAGSRMDGCARRPGSQVHTISAR